MIETLIKKELEDSKVLHEPKFTDVHHAYAIILEELEEVSEELVNLDEKLSTLWREYARGDTIPEETFINSFQLDGRHLINEAIQLNAMIDKLDEYVRSKRGDK